jgi:hypothetical protein
VSDGVLNIAAKVILSIEDFQTSAETAGVVRGEYPKKQPAGRSGTPGVVILWIVIKRLPAGTKHQRRRSQN